jgi:hypothetical protein
MTSNSLIIVRKSTFCAIVIGNGVLVAALCFMLVQRVYKERAEQLHTPEARMEYIYIRALFGVGAIVSTSTALTSLLFLKPSREE